MKIRLLQLFLVFFIYTSCESSLCDIYKPIYDTEIKGKVVKLYSGMSKTHGRITAHIIIKNYNDSIVDIDFAQGGFYENSALDDSIYKSRNSLILEIYRLDTLYEKRDINCGCSYVLY